MHWAIATRYIYWRNENVGARSEVKKKGGSVSWAALPTNNKPEQKG
jgi:hypothetical protein